MSILAKWQRRLALAALRTSDANALLLRAEKNLPKVFQHAARTVPAYRQLIGEAGIHPSQIRTAADFAAHCPLLDKDATFGRFALAELCRAGAINDLAGVLTSSGHGARFAFGLITRGEAARAQQMVDLGLELAFKIDSRRTLVINCLPMGVRIQSKSVTIADVSVREDMALALATNFGPYFDQIIFLTDPLFLKLLVDTSREKQIRWDDINVHIVIGEETFGESFREHVAEAFAIDLSAQDTIAGGGSIISSMGVGELGLNLFTESPDTVVLRRAARQDDGLWTSLYGPRQGRHQPPMLFTYNPLRNFVETIDCDADGYGDLAISMLDKKAAIPMLRYLTGDRARLIEQAVYHDAIAKLNMDPTRLPVAAVTGRAKDNLPAGLNILDFKDALYADPTVAGAITGAFRLIASPDHLRMDVHLRKGVPQDDQISRLLMTHLPPLAIPVEVSLWPYDTFPHGMVLDYERKFNYLAASA